MQHDSGAPFGTSKCPCIGLDMAGEVLINISRTRSVNYPASVGSFCKAWDYDLHPDCKKDNSPSWCRAKWCYVDPCTCKVTTPPRKTLSTSKFQNQSLFWSYETCGDSDTFSAARGPACAKQPTFNACVEVDGCLWDGEQCSSWERWNIMKTCKQHALSEDIYGKSTCKCIGPALRAGYVNATPDSIGFFPYPASVGGECRAWDDGFHPDCRTKSSPDWCKSKWCYVDPCSCSLTASRPKRSSSGAKYQGKPVYWSYGTCGGEDANKETLRKFPPSFCGPQQLVVKTPDPALPPVPAAAASTAVASVPLQAQTPDLAAAVAAADAPSPMPAPDPAAAAASAAAAAAALEPSAPSAANAAVNPAAVASAPADAQAAATALSASVGSADCPCIGIDFANITGAVPFRIRNMTVQYPVSTGSSCQAWDQGVLPECNTVSPSDAPAWCSVSWCYVDPCKCNLAEPPSKTSFEYLWQGKPLYWSASTCEVQNTSSASKSKKACVNQETQYSCLASDGCDWIGDRCLGREIAQECMRDSEIPDAVYGLRTCRCIGVGKHGWVNLNFGNETVQYPASVGENCSAWDEDLYPDCKTKNASDWCHQKWCYVDPCDCILPDSNPKETTNGFMFQGNLVYWSYSTCGHLDPVTDRVPKFSAFPPAFCSVAFTEILFVALATMVLHLLISC